MTSRDRKDVRGIPDDVYREAKANAALAGKSLGQYVTEALRDKNRKEARK